MTTSCVFCRILAGEMPASRVLETCPANPGHTLVVPHRHVVSFTDLTPAEVAETALCGQRVAAALKRGAVPCEGITVSLADGAAAGQDVPHVHLHIIPRHATDGLRWRAAGRLEQRGELDAIARQIRYALEVENAGK